MAMPPSSSSADDAFLRARCATTKNATTCYKALLPFASSFNGSQVRISFAATAVAFGQLRSFLAELRRLQAAGGTGTGSPGDQALAGCVMAIVDGGEGEEEALSCLHRLEFPGSNKERASAFFWARQQLSSAGSCTEGCIRNFVEAGNPTFSSNVGKKVVAMATTIDQYVDIALYLVVGIKL
ncbi:hypothetical protein EJB05_26214, partial [Eragrostis curvula]